MSLQEHMVLWASRAGNARCQSPEPFSWTKSKVALPLRRFLNRSQLQEREGEKEKLQGDAAKGQQRGSAGIKPALPQTSWPGGWSSFFTWIIQLPAAARDALSLGDGTVWESSVETGSSAGRRSPRTTTTARAPRSWGWSCPPTPRLPAPGFAQRGHDQQKIRPMCAAEPSSVQTCSWGEGKSSCWHSKVSEICTGEKPETPRPWPGALNPRWKAARHPALGFLSSLQSRSGFSASLCRCFQRASAGRDGAFGGLGRLPHWRHPGHHQTGAHVAHLSVLSVACFLSLHQSQSTFFCHEQETIRQHVKASALHC